MRDIEEPLIPIINIPIFAQSNLLQIENPDTCPICLKQTPLIRLPSCGHGYCKECISSYLELKTQEAVVLEMDCPVCSTNIPEEFVASLLDEKTYEKYTRFLRVKKLELDIYVKWCPVPDCKGYDVASKENKNLTCVECGFKYCYGCSSPWHSGKCKNEEDFKFKLWKLAASDLKICPRCKNYVQKEGGCPHMVCPRCRFNWCWICGKDISSAKHSSFRCMIGKSYLELYWGIILFLLLFPLFFPFLVFIFALFYYESGELRMNDLTGVFCIFRFKSLVYPCAFILSPFIEIFILIGVFFGIIGTFAFKGGRFSFTGLILGIFLAALFVILAGAVICLSFVFLPVVGGFFFIMKVFFCVARCCKPRPAFEYPRVFS